MVYAAGMRRRRERYASRPDLRRRLRHPVVSIGNLAVGGRGKTPLTATVARLLLAMGERPAILSRGYARTDFADGVVIVRDAGGIRSDLARSGDEPLMLARQLPGAIVVAGADRYAAGRLAEHHLGATVHVLDDGFQHLQLDRDVDILIVGRDDVANPVTLPTGRLREPLDTMIAADAIVTADDEVSIDASQPPIPVFRLRRALQEVEAAQGGPAFAIAGIAEPARFFAELPPAGWTVVGTRAFHDHHPYSARDLRAVVAAARAAGATRIVTTEKDLVRLLPYRPFAMPIVHVPLVLEPTPVAEFQEWLRDGLLAARDIVRG